MLRRGVTNISSRRGLFLQLLTQLIYYKLIKMSIFAMQNKTLYNNEILDEKDLA
jgi:hypothetical protein